MKNPVSHRVFLCLNAGQKFQRQGNARLDRGQTRHLCQPLAQRKPARGPAHSGWFAPHAPLAPAPQQSRLQACVNGAVACAGDHDAAQGLCRIAASLGQQRLHHQPIVIGMARHQDHAGQSRQACTRAWADASKKPALTGCRPGSKLPTAPSSTQPSARRHRNQKRPHGRCGPWPHRRRCAPGRHTPPPRPCAPAWRPLPPHRSDSEVRRAPGPWLGAWRRSTPPAWPGRNTDCRKNAVSSMVSVPWVITMPATSGRSR
jgi:hypothetical protein